MIIKTEIINTKTTDLNKLFNIANNVYTILSNLKKDYPNFKQWYTINVFNGLLSGNRTLIINIVNDEIAAISIIKNEVEKKICTIYVLSKYRRFGLGTDLFINSMDILNEDKPLFSISSKKINEFSRIIKYFGYEFTEEYSGLYIPNNKELSFNGLIK